MDAAREDVLAYMDFPAPHWTQIHFPNPPLGDCAQSPGGQGLERLDRKIKRRADVVQDFRNEPAALRLVGALMLEQSDEWAVRRRDMSLEHLAQFGDGAPLSSCRAAAAKRPEAALERDKGCAARRDVIHAAPPRFENEASLGGQ